MAASSPIALMMVTTSYGQYQPDIEAQVVKLTDIGSFFLIGPDPVTNFTLGNLDVVLLIAVRIKQVKEVVVNVRELVLSTADIGDVHVVGGRAQFFELLAGEDINTDEMDLGVTVLAGLGSAHVDNLAGTALDDDVTTDSALLGSIIHMSKSGA